MLKYDVYKLLSGFVMETLCARQVIKIEKMISDPSFSVEEAVKTSESLSRIVKWVIGKLTIILSFFKCFYINLNF